MKLKKKILTLTLVLGMVASSLPAVTMVAHGATPFEELKTSALEYVEADDQNKEWFIVDLVAAGHIFTAEEKQAFAKELAAEAKTFADTDLGKIASYTIALSALGYDASNIIFADGTKLNLPAKLIAGTNGTTSAYDLPYILIALQQNDNYATASELDAIKNWLIGASRAWMDTTYGVDGMPPAILALSPYYGETNVETLINDAVGAMLTEQKADGALYLATTAWGPGQPYGASTTGLAIAALVSIGQDPAAATHATSGNSLLEGLNEYYDAATGLMRPTDNSFATEQGLRGLIAAENFTTGTAYNVFDFSGVTKIAYNEATFNETTLASVPNTGDNANILTMIMLFISIAGMGTIIYKRRFVK